LALCASIGYNLMMSSLIQKLYHFNVSSGTEKLKFPKKTDEADDST